MTQKIDGTNAPEGARAVSCVTCAACIHSDGALCTSPVGCTPAHRPDRVSVRFAAGAKPRVILCRNSRLPAAPTWAKSARVWYKDTHTCWVTITDEWPEGREILGAFGVEFSGKVA